MSTEPTGADRLTQEALAHWYVRLLANGISYFDASEVIPHVTSWREWWRWRDRGNRRVGQFQRWDRWDGWEWWWRP